MGSLQDLPHVDMLAPITKFAATVPSTGRIADMVSMAFRECFNGAPGPSFLEIPRDVLDAKVDRLDGPHPGAGPTTERRPDPSATPTTSSDSPTSSSPPSGRACCSGSQVWTCRAADAAHEFARSLNIPGYMNGAGRGTFAAR